MEAKKMKRVTKSMLKEMSVMELMNEIVNETNDAKEFVPKGAKVYCDELMMRLSLPTPKHASLLSVFIDLSYDSSISIPDLSRHYDMRNIKMLSEKDIFKWFVENGYLRRYVRTQNQEIRYSVLHNTLECLAEGRIPVKESFVNLDPFMFIDRMSSLFNDLADENLIEADFLNLLHEAINNNQHLEFVQCWQQYCKDDETLVLYIAMSLRCINHNDDHIIEVDIEKCFCRWQLKHIVRELGDGSHPLMKRGLIENCIEDGQADPLAWKLTDKSKYEVLCCIVIYVGLK